MQAAAAAAAAVSWPKGVGKVFLSSPLSLSAPLSHPCLFAFRRKGIVSGHFVEQHPLSPEPFKQRDTFFAPPEKSLLRCHCMMSPNSGQCLANPRQDLKCVCPSSSLSAMGAKGCTERVRADRERQGNMGVLLPSRPAVFFSGVDSARGKRRRTLADGPSCVFCRPPPPPSSHPIE